MVTWTNNEINYDFVIFTKQTKNEQYIDACTTNFKRIIKYNIYLDKNFEKIIRPNEEMIFIYDSNYYYDYNYFISFDQDISLDLIDIKCSYSGETKYPDTYMKETAIFKEPGSSNSYILRVNNGHSYLTIVIKKKKLFEKEFKIIIRKRLMEGYFTGIISKQKEDNFPLVYRLELRGDLLRKITKNFELYYTEENIENINNKTVFKKGNAIISKETVVVIIPLKNLKYGEIIKFEKQYIPNLCSLYSHMFVDRDISTLIDDSFKNIFIYKEEQYKNRIILFRNIQYGNKRKNYYIINEDNIPDNESIKTQCDSNNSIYLLNNNQYVKTNSPYEIIYNFGNDKDVSSLEYFFEPKNNKLYTNNEYRFHILKNYSYEILFGNSFESFIIEIRKYSKSELLVYEEKEKEYNLGIDQNILEIEHKIGMEKMSIKCKIKVMIV